MVMVLFSPCGISNTWVQLPSTDGAVSPDHMITVECLLVWGAIFVASQHPGLRLPSLHHESTSLMVVHTFNYIM